MDVRSDQMSIYVRSKTNELRTLMIYVRSGGSPAGARGQLDCKKQEANKKSGRNTVGIYKGGIDHS